MTTLKSLTALVAATALLGLAGCGQNNQGRTDDSQMGDMAPGTTSEPTTSDPYGTAAPGQDDTMTQPEGPGSTMGGPGEMTEEPGTAEQEPTSPPQ